MLLRKCLWQLPLGLLVGAALLAATTTVGLAKEMEMPAHKQWQDKFIKELKLSPEKAKEFTGLEDKFTKERQGLYEQLNKAEADLRKTLAEPKHDEGRVKELNSSIITLKDKLWANYQEWWHGELSILTPDQQARYLLAVSEWWKNMMEKCAAPMGGK
jgi:Spy/CpxP family protein refolding chaperone